MLLCKVIAFHELSHAILEFFPQDPQIHPCWKGS